MVKTMTIDEAAKYLRENGVKISKETLSGGIQAEKLPFGLCIETGRSRVFMISSALLTNGSMKGGKSDASIPRL